MAKIDRKDLYPLTFYEYGEAYFGSSEGIRFRIAREPLENVHYTPPEKRGPAVLRASAWPEPMSYASADRARMLEKDFPVSEEGLVEICAWLGELKPDRFRLLDNG